MPEMRIGMCQKDLSGPLPETLEWISTEGFAGFQIWQQQIEQSGLSPAQLSRLAADLGLVVTAVGGGPNLVDPQTSADTIDRFRRFLDLSAELGCRIVTAESKAKPQGLGITEAWSATADTVAAICEHAEDVGAVLAIECAGPCFVAHQDDWHELARRVGSDRLKVNMDPANIVWANRDPVEAVASLAEHIVHSHAKDIVFTDAAGNNGQPGVRDVPAGQGAVDYQAYLTALQRTGYDGFLTVEMHAGSGGGTERAATARGNLRAMLDRLASQPEGINR